MPAATGRSPTGLAPGRPIHIEHGHTAGCARLGHDQAADAAARRARLPALIAASEPAIGRLRRHRLARPLIDDCPRCGWSGYFHEYLATVNGDWGNVVCDNCYADPHPAITVSVRFFSAHGGGREEPFAVIRERTRSDYRFPDLGQQLTWQLSWEHTTLLVEDARGEAMADIVPVARTTPSGSRPTWPSATGQPTQPPAALGQTRLPTVSAANEGRSVQP